MLQPRILLWLDQQSRLGQQDTNGDYLYQCPGNGKTITIPGDHCAILCYRSPTSLKSHKLILILLEY